LEFVVETMKLSDRDSWHGDSGVVPPLPPQKKLKTGGTLSTNFLGLVAQQSKNTRHARKKALVGFNPKLREEKLSHTGSGKPLSQVIRFKYQKGFTQAVKTPCRMQDLL
jgi:chromosome transmission fidelity protein 18